MHQGCYDTGPVLSSVHSYEAQSRDPASNDKHPFAYKMGKEKTSDSISAQATLKRWQWMKVTGLWKWQECPV